MSIAKVAKQQAQDLLDYIDASPSPWHAVNTTIAALNANGFEALPEKEAWQLTAGGRYYVTRDGSSIIAFALGSKPIETTGFRIVGAHTDSPGLRLKPKAAHAKQGVAQLGVEVYGGPILATFTDRDLSLAGRVNLTTTDGFASQYIHLTDSIVRLPNLAIHMNREVNSKGLHLDKQTQLPLIFGYAADSAEAGKQINAVIAKELGINPEDILNWDLNVYDTQKGSLWGADEAFIANSQLDNLASCHAALEALIASDKPTATTVCAFFDHEEVGSESTTGADGSLMRDVMQRIFHHHATDTEAQLRSIANSFLISADMAHAFHPNHPSAYEPEHHASVNQGPVIKVNANQRYTTTANTAARFIQLCKKARVPYQEYSHRTDLGCGSTIVPMISAQLGMPTVDVGNPMWAMHSIRESAGVLDHGYMIEVLKQHFLS